MAGAQGVVVQELDFLGLDKHSSERRPNFRGIQRAISKMNPEVIKSVIASATGSHSVSPPLPVYVAPPPSGVANNEGAQETAPMTIFYNGMVTAFDLPKIQAERILKMAKAEISSKNITPEKVEASSPTIQHQGNVFEEVLPVSRRKSLERFFEKRKERLMSANPYEIPKGPRANRS